MKTIILATPHGRNDALLVNIAAVLPDYRVILISGPEELTHQKLSILAPSWVFFPHWSLIIPAEIFDNFECVIFHMTDLPYGRGGSPLQNLIVRGQSETQLSALKCIKELDAGPIYGKRPLNLEGTAEDILLRASSLIQDMIIWIVKNDPRPIAQSGEVVEFKRRRPRDGDMAELEDLSKVYDYIRMLDAEGYPPSFIVTSNLHFEFTDAELKSDWVDARVRIRKRNNE